MPSSSDTARSSSVSESEAESNVTETEIVQAQLTKSRKTLKRKRRATSPSRFGQTLEALLETNTPGQTNAVVLALKPGVRRRQKEEQLEKGARKLLEGEKKEREEVGRIKDVIGGWGMEGERSLRKVAQRGVITLFNAIQQSHAAAEVAKESLGAERGTGKPRLPAPDPERNDKVPKKKKLNIVGQGKKERLDSDSFMEMIRSGGVVSKS